MPFSLMRSMLRLPPRHVSIFTIAFIDAIFPSRDLFSPDAAELCFRRAAAKAFGACAECALRTRRAQELSVAPLKVCRQPLLIEMRTRQRCAEALRGEAQAVRVRHDAARAQRASRLCSAQRASASARARRHAVYADAIDVDAAFAAIADVFFCHITIFIIFLRRRFDYADAIFVMPFYAACRHADFR